MVSFYKRWNCIWWNWLNIKTPPSAIYSNIKWFGQMLTSFEMIDSSLTRGDEQKVPAAHCSDNSGLQVQMPVHTGWRRRSRWIDSTFIPGGREFLSPLTALSPLLTSLDFWLPFKVEYSIHTPCSVKSLMSQHWGKWRSLFWYWKLSNALYMHYCRV